MIEIRFLVRAVHTLAGAAWVGGSLMYLLVVLPAFRLAGPAPALAAQVAALFKRLSNICIGALVLSGAYLVFDRLTQTTLGLLYIVVLLLKIAAASGDDCSVALYGSECSAANGKTLYPSLQHCTTYHGCAGYPGICAWGCPEYTI